VAESLLLQQLTCRFMHLMWVLYWSELEHS